MCEDLGTRLGIVYLNCYGCVYTYSCWTWEDFEGEGRESKMDGDSETTHNITDEVLAVVLDVSYDLVAHDIQDTLYG